MVQCYKQMCLSRHCTVDYLVQKTLFCSLIIKIRFVVGYFFQPNIMPQQSLMLHACYVHTSVESLKPQLFKKVVKSSTVQHVDIFIFSWWMALFLYFQLWTPNYLLYVIGIYSHDFEPYHKVLPKGSTQREKCIKKAMIEKVSKLVPDCLGHSSFLGSLDWVLST